MFSKNSFRNTFRVSSGLDPYGHSVDPDLGPNCFQRLLEDETRGPEGPEALT